MKLLSKLFLGGLAVVAFGITESVTTKHAAANEPAAEYSSEEQNIRNQSYEDVLREFETKDRVRINFLLYGTPQQIYSQLNPENNDKEEFVSLFHQQKSTAFQIVANLPPAAYEDVRFHQHDWSMTLTVTREGLDMLYSDSRIRYIANY